MSRTAIAIRHLAFEDLGGFAPVLARAGFQLRYLDIGVDTLATPEPMEADLLFVLGGPIGAYEDDRYPFLAEEIRILERRLAANRPTIRHLPWRAAHGTSTRGKSLSRTCQGIRFQAYHADRRGRKIRALSLRASVRTASETRNRG